MSLTQRERRAGGSIAIASADDVAETQTLTHIELLNAKLIAARTALSLRALALHDAITEEKLLAMTIARLRGELQDARLIVELRAKKLYDAKQDNTY